MKKLDRFVLKSFIAPFVAVLLVVVFILMLQFLWVYIDELVGKGLGLGVIMEFLFWGVCTILPLALPLATLLSSVMVVGQMTENNELMAIKASGIPFTRVILPLVVSSLLIAVAAFFVGDRLVPRAFDKIFTLRDDISKTKSEIKIPSGVFYDGIDGYILRVKDQNKKSGMLYDVIVYDHSAKKGNIAVTFADSSLIKISEDKAYLTFTLYNGSNYQEDNTIRYSDTTLTLRHIDFDRQDLLIPLDNYSFEKSDSSRYGDQAKAKRVARLKYESDSLHAYLKDQAGVHYDKMRNMSILQEYAQLDTARRNPDLRPFSHPDFMKYNTVAAKANTYKSAYDAASRYSTEVSNLKFDIYEQSYNVRHIDIELLKKFAQALACFLLFFIGAPIGALNKRKGGLGASAIVAVLFFVLYWVVDLSGSKLATDGAVKAAQGAFVSSLVLLPFCILLMIAAVKDSDIFNMDNIKTRFRILKSKVLGFFRPVRIVYMGTPEFAVEPLDALIRSGHKVVGVVTVADKPSGRGLKMNESAVKQYAVSHGLPVLQPVKLKDPEFLAALKAMKADMFVVVAFRMLPEKVWAMPRLGTFNLHAALLPQYRGAAPINWAVINGEKRTGVTTFMLDKNIDTGGIILREECLIGPEDTAGDVHDRLMHLGSQLVVQTVDALIQGNVQIRVQRSFIQGSEVLKSAPKLSRETCRIDFSAPASKVHNLIRGLSPYPGAFATLTSEDSESLEMKIFSSRVVELDCRPGQVISDHKTYLAIGCGDGRAVSLLEVQASGKKRLDVKAFLLGFRDIDKYKAELC